jgi:DNA polymerase-3 subunit epsilon
VNDQLSFEFADDSNLLPQWARRLAVFDLETTGLVLEDARIVTACVAEIDENGQLTGETFEWMANPGIEIPAQASDVHGVTTEIAFRDGRPAAEVVAELLNKLQDYLAQGIPVVAYNAPYDFTILHFEALRHGLTPLDSPGPIVDPLVIDKFVDQFRRGKRTLTIAAEHYGVELADAHNATADALAAGRVAQAIARKFAGKLPETAEELHAAQPEWSKAQDLSFEKYMRDRNPDFTARIGWPLKLG